MATEGQKKWEGKVSAKLTGYKAEQVWPFLEDFFRLDKWMPFVKTSHGVVGKSGEPGCIRYCASTSTFGEGQVETKWALEKLKTIDPKNRCLSYGFVDNNVGYSSYNATMKVTPFESSEGEGCEIVWEFSLNPMEGWTREDFFGFYESTWQASAERVKELVGAAKQN